MRGRRGAIDDCPDRSAPLVRHRDRALQGRRRSRRVVRFRRGHRRAADDVGCLARQGRLRGSRHRRARGGAPQFAVAVPGDPADRVGRRRSARPPRRAAVRHDAGLVTLDDRAGVRDRADRRPALRRGGRRARRSRRHRRRDGRPVGPVRRRGRLPPGATVARRAEDHRQVAARARHPRRRRPDRGGRHACRGGRRQHRAVPDRAGSRRHRRDEEPVHRRGRRADQGLVSARARPGGRRTGVVRAGDQQRRAARRRFRGTGQPGLPIDRHRLGDHRHPHRPVGSQHRDVAGRSARPRRWRSRRTRCSRRRSASWTN